MDEPLDPPVARQLIRTLIEVGKVTFSAHATARMVECDMSLVDCHNVLRGGRVMGDLTAFERGTWRYRVETSRMAVVVAFEGEQLLRIVTAFRLGGRA